MSRRKRQFNTTPELVIFLDRVRVVIENAEVVLSYSASNKNPHSLDGDRLFIIIHRDMEDQFRQISGFKRLPLL